VRPHKLTLEGFTSFRDKVELDFTGLDLFAITGPTGAGKSSLIDAICFALYGQVPRVGDDYKQLISHGKERLTVMLEFTVGKESYRIVRTARPDKPSQQRLERITTGTPEPVADRAREIRAEVDRILGLDYDGFTRSVVLPQGQFDAFLKGKPEERRAGWLGAELVSGLNVKSVREGSPAWRAGLTADDELLAERGFRLDSKGLQQRLEEHWPEGTLRLTLFRRDELLEVEVPLCEPPEDTLWLEPLPEATPAQRAAFTAWCGAEWPGAGAQGRNEAP